MFGPAERFPLGWRSDSPPMGEVTSAEPQLTRGVPSLALGPGILPGRRLWWLASTSSLRQRLPESGAAQGDAATSPEVRR